MAVALARIRMPLIHLSLASMLVRRGQQLADGLPMRFRNLEPATLDGPGLPRNLEPFTVSVTGSPPSTPLARRSDDGHVETRLPA